MANILVILPGLSLAALDAMSLVELGEWHERARARAPKQD